MFRPDKALPIRLVVEYLNLKEQDGESALSKKYDTLFVFSFTVQKDLLYT